MGEEAFLEEKRAKEEQRKARLRAAKHAAQVQRRGFASLDVTAWLAEFYW